MAVGHSQVPRGWAVVVEGFLEEVTLSYRMGRMQQGSMKKRKGKTRESFKKLIKRGKEKKREELSKISMGDRGGELGRCQGGEQASVIAAHYRSYHPEVMGVWEASALETQGQACILEPLLGQSWRTG